MNAAFRGAVAQVSYHEGALTHKQRVTRLYRNSLRMLLSWCIDREVFYEESDKLRARFDAVKSLEAGKGAVDAGEAEFWEKLHPDPYSYIYMPGGTKFMRNPPPPPEIVYALEDEIPKEAYTGTNTPVWPDSVPITFRPHMDGLTVDFAKKRMQ
ncbi:NADH dehydrogenase ubiquinone 1 beta subcomplex subunit 9 [Hondaea fermentalgiana]|uniref:NADH dehydrogenase [ubiquinone] 1 beta subcomplex subunit 9 n=1 Tax=Hondaea fermentalgiana TaxID=2315210 RepID=A0A2R5GXF6_9STRA|nr:NADH dehydrogenase ubiquinone 1 beta subcomplex subunit 9 [Hondaea fermentalgiana]|eukprot:GBG34468.1 NADH dehydrogenase ubiquinone 1 beta subcomplex subunit 9 [Hondaea fermentalgiana]